MKFNINVAISYRFCFFFFFFLLLFSLSDFGCFGVFCYAIIRQVDAGLEAHKLSLLADICNSVDNRQFDVGLIDRPTPPHGMACHGMILLASWRYSNFVFVFIFTFECGGRCAIFKNYWDCILLFFFIKLNRAIIIIIIKTYRMDQNPNQNLNRLGLKAKLLKLKPILRFYFCFTST